MQKRGCCGLLYSYLTHFCRYDSLISSMYYILAGSKELFLLVLNGGENTLKVHVNVPETSGSPLLVFEVPKHETKRVSNSIFC